MSEETVNEKVVKRLKALGSKLEYELDAEDILTIDESAKMILALADEVQSLWDMLEEKDEADRAVHTAIVTGAKMIKFHKKQNVHA